jgi:hypothetical protein
MREPTKERNAMKRKISGVIVALTLLIAGFTLLSPAPAYAGDGCTTNKSKRISAWSHQDNYQVPVLIIKNIPVLFSVPVKIFANMFYLYCPNGEHPDKVKPLGIDWCYTHLDNYPKARWWFLGTRNDAFIRDDTGRSMNPGAFHMLDRGRQNCGYQRFAGRKWFLLDNDPKWTATTFFELRGPDEKMLFHAGGDEWRNFDPPNDRIVKLGIR